MKYQAFIYVFLVCVSVICMIWLDSSVSFPLYLFDGIVTASEIGFLGWTLARRLL